MNITIKYQQFYILFMSMTLTACSFIPEYQQPEIETPEWRGDYQNGDVKEIKNSDTPLENELLEIEYVSEISPEWWEGFNSSELNGLIDQALNYNNDIAASLQRVQQTRANLEIAGADLLPSANVITQYMNASTTPMNITTGRNQNIPSYSLAAGISYEIDLFGKNNAKEIAAQEQLNSALFEHDALALIIMADVAQQYFNLLQLKKRMKIANEMLSIEKEKMQWLEARFQTSSSSRLDIAKQEAAIERLNSRVLSIEQQVAIIRNSLAVLVGEPPQRFTINSSSLDTINPPKAELIQPADLLERRPDIKSITAKLKASNADLGIAKASVYPSIQISPALLLAANPSASQAVLSSSIIAPIFQGGRLQGAIDRVTAEGKELVEKYQQQVLIAFKETEDALIKLDKGIQKENALKVAWSEAQKATKLAEKQYTLSLIDFSEVLAIEREELNLADEYEQARYQTFAARIELFKALGGGWREKDIGQNI